MSDAQKFLAVPFGGESVRLVPVPHGSRGPDVFVKSQDYDALLADRDRLAAELAEAVGAAAWIKTWMVAEKYRKPDVPHIIAKATKDYKKTLDDNARLQAELSAARAALAALWVRLGALYADTDHAVNGTAPSAGGPQS